MIFTWQKKLELLLSKPLPKIRFFESAIQFLVPCRTLVQLYVYVVLSGTLCSRKVKNITYYREEQWSFDLTINLVRAMIKSIQSLM